ncbi:MAG: hypothetical protein V1871_00565 [Planctomycetota bacterium]
MDMSYVEPILICVSLLASLLLEWKIQKLKDYVIDKDLKLNAIQIDETKAKYKQMNLSKRDELAKRGMTLSSNSSIYESEMQKLKDEEKRELDKLEVEKKCQLKLKSYRFPWCKK